MGEGKKQRSFQEMQTLKTTAKSKQATEQTEPPPEWRSSFFSEVSPILKSINFGVEENHLFQNSVAQE